MGKQYISTALALNAHDLDIVGLAIVSKYTITVSSDGHAKFWDNKLDEGLDPKASVVSAFVSKSGVHGVAAYENTLSDSHIKVVLLAFTCFDGSLVLKYFTKDDISTLADVACPSNATIRYWAPAFYKDPSSKLDLFLCTKTKGATDVFEVKFESEANDSLRIAFEKYGEFGSSNTAHFPYSIAVSDSENGVAAVGYSDGDVTLYSLATLKTMHTFNSTDLRFSKAGTDSMPRALAFSPRGDVLAVARDNQSSGSITLYDVTYGENVGTLTTPSHSNSTTVGGFAHDGFIMGLSFDEEGRFLASCGFDMCVRVWDMSSREREATIMLSPTDFELDAAVQESDKSIASGVAFIRKNVRAGAGAATNEGLCVISFDRGIRWFREAGGI